MLRLVEVISSKVDAQALGNTIDFSFVVALAVVRYILDLNRPATVKLQRKEIDGSLLVTKYFSLLSFP